MTSQAKCAIHFSTGSGTLPPFTHLNRGAGRSPFYNGNTAGSYAPSSLREDVAPFLRIVTIKGSGTSTSYSLDPGHATKAFDELLFKKTLPATSLAIFLYRDYGFNHPPSARKILDTFRDEFGFRSSEPSEVASFERLFNDDSSDYSMTDYFMQTREGTEDINV